MMKKYFFTFFIGLIVCSNAFSTTYTSAQNGNWMNPTTWSPIGIPLPGDDITINHVVTLDTSFAYTSGSISVLGSLINDSFGRDLWLNGATAQFQSSGIVTLRAILISQGTFINSGVLNVNRLANYATFTNNDSMLGVDSLFNNGQLTNNWNIQIMTFFNNNTMNNYGTIKGLTTVVDSMYNNGSFTNHTNGLIQADSCTNSGTFVNDGTLEYSQYTNIGTFTNNNTLSFDDITNFGTFHNNSTMVGNNSMWNVEVFNNNAGAQIDLANSFLNADSTASGATFNNDGSFDIGDSFYNFNDITGSSTGSFTMQDTSYNSGTMTGSFDFCDATPPPSSPYIDINLGTVDPLITYCAATTINEIKHIDFTIYPNPTEGYVYFGNVKQFVQVYSAEGKKIIDDYTNQINLERFNPGIYYLMINDEKGNRIYNEKIVKE